MAVIFDGALVAIVAIVGAASGAVVPTSLSSSSSFSFAFRTSGAPTRGFPRPLWSVCKGDPAAATSVASSSACFFAATDSAAAKVRSGASDEYVSTDNPNVNGVYRIGRGDGDSDGEGGNGLTVRPARPEEMEIVASLAVGIYSGLELEGSSSESDSGVVGSVNFLKKGWKVAVLWFDYWVIYLGMIERLLWKSFEEGMRGEGYEDGSGRRPPPRHMQEIFVVESSRRLRPDGSKPEVAIVGAVEMCMSPCPLPFGRVRRGGGGERGDDDDEEDRRAPLVCNLSVHPSHRRQGAARLLLSACESSAGDAHSYGEIWLETYCHNTGALRLYKGEGWTCEGVDKDGREPRRAFFRKRLRDEGKGVEEGCVPELGKDILRFELARAGGREDQEKEEEEEIVVARFDVDENGTCVAPAPFLERHFGALAPLVAVVGVLVGAPFWKRK